MNGKESNASGSTGAGRGLEVIIATGKSILKWQDLNNKFYQRDDFINIISASIVLHYMTI